MDALSLEKVTTALRWRYAVKKFDAGRKIDSATWAALEEALILSPSSYGLQPWKFIVVTSDALKSQLRPVSWNQEQITSCSHLVVCCIRENVGAKEIEEYTAHIAEVRGQSMESLAQCKGMMMGSIVKGPIKSRVNEWAQRQVYIALGNLLTTAALLNVDTCPMEGFDPTKYNEILNLSSQGLGATVLCALGYRAEDDKYQTAKKVRFPRDKVIEIR